MFFKWLHRNSKKSSRENGIYFACLVISIVACYVILALEKQDVMIFLKQMESDAVKRLLGLLSGAYGASLCLIFFLIYFAQKYQLERRSHEFGLLLMLGMKRSRMFLWLMAEDLYSSAVALVIGLPLAVFLSEGISLITARLIGLGIIGHHFALSIKACVLTNLGFLGVKMAANILLSFRMVKREPDRLMRDSQEQKQRTQKEWISFVLFLAGVILLGTAYALAIYGRAWTRLFWFALTLLLGMMGTLFFIKGFCAVFSHMAKKCRQVSVFTFRQLQENVFLRSFSLTVSSLLVLVAIVCMSYGISVAVANVQNGDRHTMDFTVETYDEEEEQQLRLWSERKEVRSRITAWSRVLVAMLPTKEVWGEETDVATFDYNVEGLDQAASQIAEELQECYENSASISRKSPYMIALSGWNEIRKNGGKEEVKLHPGELALYMDSECYSPQTGKMFQALLEQNPRLVIDGKEYKVKGIYTDDIVVDRSITIGFGILLPDEDFFYYADKNNISTYWNAYLSKDLVEKEGLLAAIQQVNQEFEKSGFTYENYLQNMGRQLFYIVAASYLTIYLAVIFLLIANTVISLQFLMQEKRTQKRYHTLVRMGSTYEALCQSSRRQIRWYFGVPVGVAAVSSVFGVRSLFTGMLPSSLTGEVKSLLLISCAMILVLCVIEYIYMKTVMKASSRNILNMLETKRSE